MSDVVRKRWKLLGEVLSRRRHLVEGSVSSVSVRRFTSFGLVATELVKCDEGEDSIDEGTWYVYSCEHVPEFSAYIRHVADKITLDTLLGFNNTGNVCVWPSEEVLTYYCLKHADIFRAKEVCELGGGMTCLAGVALAMISETDKVLLTDGNEQSVASEFKRAVFYFKLLRWTKDGEVGELEGQFDFVISADCLFFDEGRRDLACTIFRLLRPHGEAIIMAPRRGDTLQKFIEAASHLFTGDCIRVVENYDHIVTDLDVKNVTKGLDVYDKSIHYPLMIRMYKSSPLQSNEAIPNS